MLISFDICDFYPSITNKLLEKSLTFASQFFIISAEDIRIIKHTKKHYTFPWARKSSKFDVTMGSFDSAEVCELVGILSPITTTTSVYQCRTLKRRRASCHGTVTAKYEENKK